MIYDVLVSGGGPVGLGLAIELGQRGHRVAVVERSPDPGRIPKGQNLTQRSMETLRAWGVEDEIRDAKTVPKGIGLGGVTAYRALASDYHYDWYNRADVRAYYAAASERLPQYETERVLRARMAELESVDFLLGWTTETVETGADGAALTIARDGETRRLEAPFLVGCDGSRSLVRETSGISETVRDHDRLMVLVVFRSPEVFALVSERFPDKQFFNVLHPDLAGYWMFFGAVDWGETFFFHAPVPNDTERAGYDPTELIRRAVGAPVEVEPEHVGFWDLRIAIADRYRTGPVFIAGDAAHSHPPYGGYGVNNGFEDARNLGWKLAAQLEGWGGPGLLDSYDAERRPVFRSTAEDFIERFIHDDRAFLDAHDPARDRAGFETAWAARASRTASDGIGGYVPNYDGSPIVLGTPGASPGAVGEHSFTARAGHHLPPLQEAEGGSPGIEPGEGFVVLCGGAHDPGFAQAAARLGLPLRVVTGLGSGPGGYGAAFVLVRPDGFVAWCGAAPDDPGAILARASGH